MSGAEQRQPAAGSMRVPKIPEVVEYARRFGWRRAMQRGAYVAINQGASVSVFGCCFMRREHMNSELLQAGAGYEGRFLDRADVAKFAGQLEEALVRDLDAAAGRGDEIYAVFDGDRVANIACHAVRPAPLMKDLEVGFEPPSIYTHRNFTPVPYRGRKLHAVGILRAADELFDRDIPQILCVCEMTNYPALISLQRMGWQPSGRLWRTRVGMWNRLGRSAEAAALGMHLAIREARL